MATEIVDGHQRVQKHDVRSEEIILLAGITGIIEGTNHSGYPSNHGSALDTQKYNRLNIQATHVRGSHSRNRIHTIFRNYSDLAQIIAYFNNYLRSPTFVFTTVICFESCHCHN